MEHCIKNMATEIFLEIHKYGWYQCIGSGDAHSGKPTHSSCRSANAFPFKLNRADYARTGAVQRERNAHCGLGTKEGLLICADKRTYDPLRGALDTEVKIVELTPTAVFAWTGIPVFYEILSDRTPDQPSLRVAFSAVDVVKGYFLNNRFSNTNDFWRGLSLALKEQFEKFLYAWPFTSWPETGNPPDNALFQLAFFYTDSANVPGAVLIRLCYEKSIPPPSALPSPKYRDPVLPKLDP